MTHSFEHRSPSISYNSSSRRNIFEAIQATPGCLFLVVIGSTMTNVSTHFAPLVRHVHSSSRLRHLLKMTTTTRLGNYQAIWAFVVVCTHSSKPPNHGNQLSWLIKSLNVQIHKYSFSFIYNFLKWKNLEVLS